MKEYNLSKALKKNRDLKEEVERKSGVRLTDCYQCGKCAAGCPVAFAMDFTPRQIIRLLQVGLGEQALKSHSVWLCAACETCYARCPHGVDIPRIMENIRILADERGIKPERTLDLFSNLFLKSVEKFGRVHEMGLIVRYNMLALKPFQDAELAPKLFFSGKISPLPHKIKDGGAVKRIFENVRARGGDV